MPARSLLETSASQGLVQRLIPGMFQRRLRLLALAVIIASALLSIQMTRLTVARHAELRLRAEAVRYQQRLIPTARGRILDRRQRVLAMDRSAYDVAVHYEVITGRWAQRQAALAARRAAGNRWAEFDRTQRDEAIDAQLPIFAAQVEQLWEDLARLGRIDRVELEDHKADVVSRVQATAAHVWLLRFQERSAVDQDVTLADVSQPISEQRAEHAILFNADVEAISEVRRRIAHAAERDSPLRVWQQVEVMPSRQREYPLTDLSVTVDRGELPAPLKSDTPREVRVVGVATHIVGTMRDVWQEDVQGVRDAAGNVLRPGRPFRTDRGVDLGGYLAGDRVGSTGVERSMEQTLRGLRGRVLEDVETRQQQRVEPTVGGDVVLTIDVQLQARLQAVLDPELGLMRRQRWHEKNMPEGEIGRPLNGAAVVLDVANSQVLAAVSTPTRAMDDASRLEDQVNRPYVNRAVAEPYQPGSTVKPLVLAAAFTRGKIASGQTIDCQGYLDEGHPERYRCWIFKTWNSQHGPLQASEAVARSCNVFFYTLGRRLGARSLVRAYHDFGLGSPLGCGLEEEVGGDLPDLLRAEDPNAPGFTPADAIQMAIGQGPIRWTPLQAASCYAALARGGYHIAPTFLLTGARQNAVDLRLSPVGVEAALQGLDAAVNEEYGTGHHVNLEVDGQRLRQVTFTLPGVKVLGKTGTADAVPLRIDSDRDGRITSRDTIVRDGDHAWFVGLVHRPGSRRADFAVAVVVEFAGSGGAVAGPIANQVLYALRAEGYL